MYARNKTTNSRKRPFAPVVVMARRPRKHEKWALAYMQVLGTYHWYYKLVRAPKHKSQPARGGRQGGNNYAMNKNNQSHASNLTAESAMLFFFLLHWKDHEDHLSRSRLLWLEADDCAWLLTPGGRRRSLWGAVVGSSKFLPCCPATTTCRGNHWQDKKKFNIAT